MFKPFTSTSSSSSSRACPTPRALEEYVQIAPGAVETQGKSNSLARNGISGVTLIRKSAPKISAFKRTRSREKDKIFSGFETMPSMGKPSTNPNQIYNITCSQQRAAFLVSAGAEVFADAQFTLADWNGSASLQGVFDQYRIVGVEVWLVPRVNVNSSSTNDTGIITSVIDYDDSGTTTQAQMTEYTSYMVSTGMCGHYRSFVPAAIITVDGVEANVEKEKWLDCTFGAVVHRGVKFAISSTTTAQDNDLFIRMHLQFRNIH